MSRFPESLPASAVDILDGQSKARDVGEGLICAYWMHSRDNGTALYLLQQAHADLAALADAMGYTITRKPDPNARIVELKAEWERVCTGMNSGGWRGTEAEALAEIERIKAEIAKLEAAK